MSVSRAARRAPSICHHKPSGQAVVYIGRKATYLGLYGSAESHTRYAKFLSTWSPHKRPKPVISEAPITVTQLIALFWRHIKVYYRRADGTPTGEAAVFKSCFKPLKELYGTKPAAEFSPLKLSAVRNRMIDLGWKLTTINRQITRVRRVFKWGIKEELIAPGILEGLKAVDPLKPGRCEAAESDPVKPVPIEYVDAVERWVSPQIWAMIQLQLLTGMRPGEVITIKGCEIETTGELWVYRPPQHKNAYRNHKREIYFAARAQSLIKPFLKADLAAPFFSPAAAEELRRRLQHIKRKTPLKFGNRPGTNRKRKPKWRPGGAYTVASYRRAIERGCDRADAWMKGGLVIGNDERVIPIWTPNQLRHNVGTELRKRFGIEAASVLLGHKSVNVTEIYAEKNFKEARRIAAEVG